MIVDASAILAIVFGEEEAQRFSDAIGDTAEPWVSAVNWFEAAIRVDRLSDPTITQGLDAVMSTAGILIKPITTTQAELARLANARFGKGRHPAKLNLGDCFAYALARESGRPLLFKGGDFARTDIEPALPPG